MVVTRTKKRVGFTDAKVASKATAAVRTQLNRVQTTKGIRLGATYDAVKQAYPNAVAYFVNAGEERVQSLEVAAGGAFTQFSFAGGTSGTVDAISLSKFSNVRRSP